MKKRKPSTFYPLDFLSLTQASTVAPSAMRPSSVTKLMGVTQPGTSSLKAAREISPSLCTLPALGHLLMTIENGPTVNNMDVQISRRDTLAILDINSPLRVNTFLSDQQNTGECGQLQQCARRDFSGEAKMLSKFQGN